MCPDGSRTSDAGRRIDAWVATHRDDIVDLASELIAIPSATEPPAGHEARAQTALADIWARAGGRLDVFAPDEVREIADHPLYRPEWDGMRRPLSGRPVVVARWRGRPEAPGAGPPPTSPPRSLLLSAHVDTMPAGLAPWTVTAPFAPRVVGNRLYGRGSYDTKGMFAVYTAVVRCAAELGLQGRGDLIVESVCDEEYGGSHGCLAARLRGHRADAAINGEPTHMIPCISHNGGGEWRVSAGGGGGGMAFAGEDLGNPITTLAEIALAVDRWRQVRECAARTDGSGDSAPGVYIAQVCAGGSRYADLFGVPADGHMYLWIEEGPDVTAEAHAAGLRAALADVPRNVPWSLRQTIRYLP